MAVASEILMAGMVSAGAGIVGAVTGFCTHYWLRTLGEERVFTSNWKILYRGRGESGGPVDVPPSEAEFVQIFFTADFFSTRNEPTGLRQVCIEFHSAGKSRLSITPGDANSLKVGAMREDMADVQVINLAPRQWAHWQFRRNVWGDDVKAVVAAEQVFLTFADPEGKTHRHLVADLPRKTLAFAGR